MAYSTDYDTTFEAVLRYLKAPERSNPSDIETADYDLIENAITAAYLRCKSICRQPIKSETIEKIFYTVGAGGFTTLPSLRAPLAITNVYSKEDAFENWTTLTTDDWALVGTHLYLLEVTPIGKVTFTSGWTDSALPENIRQVIVEMAAVIFDESKRGKGRLAIATEGKSLSGGTGTLNTAFRELEERHKEVLHYYTVILP